MTLKAIASPRLNSRLFRRWYRGQDGSVSVEAALWLPIFMGLILLITNTSLVFYGQSQAMRVVQDANRAFSTGRLATEADVQAFIVERLAPLTSEPIVETVVHQGVIYTTAQLPVEDLAHIGTLNMFSGYHINVASQFFVEYMQ
jgi:Flp pilus assembly protein TadG